MSAAFSKIVFSATSLASSLIANVKVGESNANTRHKQIIDLSFRIFMQIFFLSKSDRSITFKRQK